MKPISPADRALLASLAARLEIQDWHVRNDGSGPRFVAGSRGTIRVVAGSLVITLRPSAAVEVEGLRQRLIAAGVLRVEGADVLIAHLPEGTEIEALRNLIGLHRAWQPCVVRA